MSSIEEIKQSVFNRDFMGANPLPISAYILSIVNLVQQIPLVRFVFTNLLGSLTVFALLTQIISKACLNKSQRYGLTDYLIVAFFSLRSEQSIHATLTGLVIFLLIKKLIKINLLETSVYLCLLCISDSSFIPLGLLISAVQMWNITNKLVHPEIKIKTAVKDFFKFILMIFVIPLAFLISFLSVDLLVRNKHSLKSLEYSLELQARLENFDIKNSMDKAHSPAPISETDLYVMDRSIISMINAKHKTFFKLDDGISSFFESVPFCEIHKVHQNEFTDEEPRFIKNGDVVKFKDLNSEKFLGWDKKDNKSKFRNIFVGAFKDKEDFWVVECDGYLQARAGKVSFRSIKSNDYLCARKVKKMGSLSVSWTPEKRAKVFYITENANHSHYKATFEDKRSKLVVNEFKKQTFLEMLFEYVFSIKTSYNEGFNDSKPLGYFAILLFLFSFITLIVTYIVNIKFNQKTIISEETVISMLSVVFLLVFLPIIGLKLRNIEICSLMFTVSLVKDLLRGAKINLDMPTKVNWKKLQ